MSRNAPRSNRGLRPRDGCLENFLRRGGCHRFEVLTTSGKIGVKEIGVQDFTLSYELDTLTA